MAERSDQGALRNMPLRDWLYIAAIIGAAAVANYRLGALENRFATFEANYVRADVFKLTIDNLTLRMENAAAQTRAELRQQPTYRTPRSEPASIAPKQYPSIIPQYDTK